MYLLARLLGTSLRAASIRLLAPSLHFAHSLGDLESSQVRLISRVNIRQIASTLRGKRVAVESAAVGGVMLDASLLMYERQLLLNRLLLGSIINASFLPGIES